MRRPLQLAVVLVGLGIAAFWIDSPSTAHAATFTVEDGAAVGDGEPGDGVCRSKLRPGTILRRCTFMAAVEESNALPGAHTIILPSGTFRFDPFDGDFADRFTIRGRMTVIGAGAAATEIKNSALVPFGTGITILPGASIELRNLTYSESKAIVNTGGTLIINNSVIRDNNGLEGAIGQRRVAGESGGAFTTTIVNSRVTGNRDSLVGATAGGAINIQGGTMLIESSTIDSNHSNGADPGAVNVGGLVSSTLTMRNVTVSGNTSQAGPGGIAAGVGGTLIMRNVTIANNSQTGLSTNSSAGPGTIDAENVLLANNGSQNCSQVSTSFNRAVTNLSSDLSCASNPIWANLSNNNLNNVNPLLGALQNNGGPTLTHLPVIGSPATRAGSCLLAADQRGFARPVTECDIGSVEVPNRVFPIPPLGVFNLNPGSAKIRPNDTLTETFVWDVPAPANWTSLGTLDIRLRLRGAIVFWLRWDQTLDTFQLIDNSGTPTGLLVPAGLAVPLTANGITFDTAAARAQGSGPTGQRATLVIPLRFDQNTLGSIFDIEVSGQDDEGRQDPFSTAGQIAVVADLAQAPGTIVQPRNDDDDKKKQSKLDKLRSARTNQGGLDDERTAGFVLSVWCDQNQVEIAGMDGPIVLKLRGDSRKDCPSVRVGAYISADGEKETENLFWADEIEIDD